MPQDPHLGQIVTYRLTKDERSEFGDGGEDHAEECAAVVVAVHSFSCANIRLLLDAWSDVVPLRRLVSRHMYHSNHRTTLGQEPGTWRAIDD